MGLDPRCSEIAGLINRPSDTQIDSEHPLARGLVSFLPLNQGSGNSLFDIVGGLPLSLSGGVWSAGSQAGLSLTANSAGAVTSNLPPSLQGGWPITLACGFRQLATPVSSAVLFGTSYNNVAGGNSSWMVAQLLRCDRDSVVLELRRTAG